MLKAALPITHTTPRKAPARAGNLARPALDRLSVLEIIGVEERLSLARAGLAEFRRDLNESIREIAFLEDRLAKYRGAA